LDDVVALCPRRDQGTGTAGILRNGAGMRPGEQMIHPGHASPHLPLNSLQGPLRPWRAADLVARATTSVS